MLPLIGWPFQWRTRRLWRWALPPPLFEKQCFDWLNLIFAASHWLTFSVTNSKAVKESSASRTVWKQCFDWLILSYNAVSDWLTFSVTNSKAVKVSSASSTDSSPAPSHLTLIISLATGGDIVYFQLNVGPRNPGIYCHKTRAQTVKYKKCDFFNNSVQLFTLSKLADIDVVNPFISILVTVRWPLITSGPGWLCFF